LPIFLPRFAAMSSRSASTRNAYVYAEDTDEEDLDKIKNICGDVFEASPTGGSLYGELAKRIRSLLDKEMGVRGWNVVVGRSFGAYLTQRVRRAGARATRGEGERERWRSGTCRARRVLAWTGRAGGRAVRAGAWADCAACRQLHARGQRPNAGAGAWPARVADAL
jgi:hypothetical protein